MMSISNSSNPFAQAFLLLLSRANRQMVLFKVSAANIRRCQGFLYQFMVSSSTNYRKFFTKVEEYELIKKQINNLNYYYVLLQQKLKDIYDINITLLD